MIDDIGENVRQFLESTVLCWAVPIALVYVIAMFRLFVIAIVRDMGVGALMALVLLLLATFILPHLAIPLAIGLWVKLEFWPDEKRRRR